MTTAKILLLTAFLSKGILSTSQLYIDSVIEKIDPQKWSASIERKAEKLQERIISESLHTLSKLQKQEEKIYRKMLTGKDSLLANAALTDIKSKYSELQNKIKNPAIVSEAKQYIPKLDSLTTSLKFLDQSGVGGKVKDALSKTESLQNKFQQAEEIKKFMRERKQQLKEQLEKLGLARQLKQYNKEVYYYSEQIKEYKEILKDSKKREQKALELLSKTKLFKDFMRKNSILASLFRLPGDPQDPLSQASVAGLQTRAQVNNLIQQQIGSGGPNAMQQFRDNFQNTQSQINQLKNKIIQSGGGSSDDIMPDGFKPNNQKTKGFLKRLEFGFNIQTQKAANLFPVMSDLGLSLGYKLNNKSIIGIGVSYKMGWGKSIRHIDITHQGAGVRSFVDWQLKGSFWISGGYEMNYQNEINRIDQLRNLHAWQQSGLLGLSKIFSIRSKLFKKTKIQLLWDFLSYQQIPRSQPLIFRIGYNLK